MSLYPTSKVIGLLRLRSKDELAKEETGQLSSGVPSSGRAFSMRTVLSCSNLYLRPLYHVAIGGRDQFEGCIAVRLGIGRHILIQYAKSGAILYDAEATRTFTIARILDTQRDKRLITNRRQFD